MFNARILTRTSRPWGLACFVAAASFTACGTESSEDVLFDAGQAVEGIPELSDELTPLTTACAFASATGIVTVTIESGEVAVISKRAVDSVILANGVACGTATSTTAKRINVVENSAATGNEVVILDFINGVFGSGTATAVAINVDMGTGTTDALKIRGSTGADTVTFGDSGISTGLDNNKDIGFTAVDEFTFSLGAGNDVFTAQGGRGTGGVFASAVTAYGGDGNDTVTGGSGADDLYGGEGNDTLVGSTGDDTLNGDAGADTFNEEAASNGADTFNGGAGVDTVSYALRTVAVVVTMGGVAANDGEAGETDDFKADVEGVIGSTVADTLTGDANDNVISGGGGDDDIIGGLGNDTLNGDAGDDSFDEGSATSGSDVITGGAGTDEVDYSARTVDLVINLDGVALDGESGELDNVKNDVENVIGGDGNDTITGSSSANVLTGGDGDDTLNGSGGDDTFAEGTADNGSDVFNGGAGTDTVDYSGRTAALDVSMDGVAADDGGIAGPEGDNVKSDVENLSTGSGADDIWGNASANVIKAGDGIDIILGGAGNDDIDGEAGDDIIGGEAGNDILYGGADDDALDGGANDDILDGGAGTDTLDCGAGDGDIAFETSTNCEL